MISVLYRLFHDRFFEADEASSGSSEAKFYQALGLLAVPGLVASMFLLPQFMELSFRPPGPALDWALRFSRLFFPLYSFTVVGFATFHEGERLFPSRRDFLILTPFPIQPRDLFLAKLAALGRFLGAILIAVNAFAILLLPVFSAYIKQARTAGVVRLALVQAGATAIAALFAFFAIAALQGIMMNILSPRRFRQIFPWVQLAGMSAMVICLVLYPLWSVAMKPLAEARPDLLRYLPVYWFVGTYDLVLSTHGPLFASLGILACRSLGIAFLLFVATWTFGFARYWRRTLESEDRPLTPSPRLFPDRISARFFRSPEEFAIFRFAGATLAKSQKHRVFLATWLSTGIAFAILLSFVIKKGVFSISPDGLRASPLLLTFFSVAGFRAAFQMPAELDANWLFQLAETEMRETARRATRKRVIASALLPTLLLFMPVEVVTWGWTTGLFHTAFQLATGLLLVEALFWNFDRVPFTCSWFPGAANVALLAGLYLYGFTNYSFRLAELEGILDTKPLYAALFLAGASAALVVLWRRREAAATVRFDGAEPELQALNL